MDVSSSYDRRLQDLERQLAETRDELRAIYSQRYDRLMLRTSIPGVPWVNRSGYEVPAYGVMEVVDLEDGDRFAIERPGSTFRRRYLVNGSSSAVADDASSESGTWLETTGKVLLAPGGRTVDLDAEWGVEQGSFALARKRYGFQLKSDGIVESGATYAWAIQREVTRLLAKTESSVSLGSTGTFYVYDNNTLSIETGVTPQANGTPFTISAVARFGAIASNKWCELLFLASHWYAVQLEC